MGWTDEQVEKLKGLCNEGHSFSTIARVIGGVTRNACISKAHRLGINNGVPSHGKGHSRAGAQPRKRHNDGLIAAPKLAVIIPRNEPEPLGPVKDFPPAGTCRFIRAEIATDIDWRCCGAPAPDFARPYCSFHLPRVYQSPITRQRDKGASELAQIARNLRKLEAAE